MSKTLIKGNEAVVKAAVLAGCQSFYGYPITPASEITEAAAHYFPKVGRTFLQAESEVAAINMIYGAAAAGERTMTASSGPGFSLMQEGISYLAGAELPCVLVDVMRAGPGLGNIAPEQGDYHQVVKGGGHGNYRTIVLAPNSAQEMADMTFLAFDWADRWRNPVVVLADGCIGQMMEPVLFPRAVAMPPPKPWAVTGAAETRKNLVTSIHLAPEALEQHGRALQKKYARLAPETARYEEYKTDDAEFVTIGYGIVSRLLKTAVDQARALGLRIGLFRPCTLWPFPAQALTALSGHVDGFLVVELSDGQLVDDVRLAVGRERPVLLYTRFGGTMPSTEELLEQIFKACEVSHVHGCLPEVEQFLQHV